MTKRVCFATVLVLSLLIASNCNRPSRTEGNRSARLTPEGATTEIRTPPLQLAPRRAGLIRLKLIAPEGFHFLESPSGEWQVWEDSSKTPLAMYQSKGKGVLSRDGEIRVPVTLRPNTAAGVTRVEVIVYYCSDGVACARENLMFVIPVFRGEGGRDELYLEHPLKHPLD